jgi:hypothetical protein
MSTYTQSAVAINAEPGARDTFSLRSMQHKDREGKIISTLLPDTGIWFMDVDYLLTCSQLTLTSPTPRETASSDHWIRFEALKQPLNLIASKIECEMA